MRNAGKELVPLALQIVSHRFESLAFDGVPHRAQNRSAIHLGFYEVVLGAFLDRPHCERLVVQTTQHDDGDIRRVRMEAGKRLKTLAIWQREIQQDDVRSVVAQPLQSKRKVVGVRQVGSDDQVVLITDAEPATASLVTEAAALLRREDVPIWLLVNKMSRSRTARLDLPALESYIPQARGLVTVAFEQRAARIVSAGLFDWRDAPKSWRRSVREVAADLVAAWPSLDVTIGGRPPR